MANDLAKEADELLESIGDVINKLEIQENQLNERIKKVKGEFGDKIDELTKRRDDLAGQLAGLAKQHRKELVEPGTKMISLRHGQIRWRRSPRALEVEDHEAIIIERIRRLRGLRTFTRVGKRTLDKTKLKAAPGFVTRVKGLKITQTEDLVIDPAKVQSEIVRTGDPLKFPASQEGED